MRITGNLSYRNNWYEVQQKDFGTASTKNVNRDEYIPTNNSAYLLYGKGNCGDNGLNSVLDYINFCTERIFCRKENLFGDTEYNKGSLAKIDESKSNFIKAETNKIVFDNMNYYKYKDKDGNCHIFSCVNNILGQPYSDLISGRQSDLSYNIGKFWNLLSRDGTYISLYYSKGEQKQFLNDAGITEGFFSVQIGKNEQDYYYSNGNAGVAVRKFEYDATYDMFVSRGTALFDKYEVGDVFTISGKEYTLNEQKKLDIPYGEDIFDIQFPKVKTQS